MPGGEFLRRHVGACPALHSGRGSLLSSGVGVCGWIGVPRRLVLLWRWGGQGTLLCAPWQFLSGWLLYARRLPLSRGVCCLSVLGLHADHVFW